VPRLPGREKHGLLTGDAHDGRAGLDRDFGEPIARGRELVRGRAIDLGITGRNMNPIAGTHLADGDPDPAGVHAHELVIAARGARGRMLELRGRRCLDLDEMHRLGARVWPHDDGRDRCRGDATGEGNTERPATASRRQPIISDGRE